MSKNNYVDSYAYIESYAEEINYQKEITFRDYITFFIIKLDSNKIKILFILNIVILKKQNGKNYILIIKTKIR